MSGPTYGEQLRAIVAQYQRAGGSWPATSADMAAWAIRTKAWTPQPRDLIQRLSEQLSEAMREEYIIDPQGRKVRAKHAARRQIAGEQRMFWADIRTADVAHMQIAFQQRRQQIVGDCRQLKVDVDSYNENAAPKRPIQMIFDFTDDLLELEALESRDAA